MSNNKIHFLCAGAAQGLVKALQPLLLEETGAHLEGSYGAVGVMKEALLAGEPCDLMIVTEKMIADLRAGKAIKPGPQNSRKSSEPEGGALTLTDKSLYDGSVIGKYKVAPPPPPPEPKKPEGA